MNTENLKGQIILLQRVCDQLSSIKHVKDLSSTSKEAIHFCRDLLALPDSELRKLPNNASSTVNRFRISLDSLIQSRNEAQKLAAIYLIKASIAAGGYEVVAKSGRWAECLIRCLSSRSLALRQLALRTVVSIYKATHGRPVLLKEITTQTLPGFIKSCLDAIAPRANKSDERRLSGNDTFSLNVLQALSVLLPSHPVTFRPFIAQIREVLDDAIFSSDREIESIRSDRLRATGQVLHALLPQSATKAEGGPGGRWLTTIQLLRQHIEHNADEIFRSIEAPRTDQPQSSLDLQHLISPRSDPEDPPSCEIIDGLRLKKWVGVEAGVARVVALLHTIEAYISTKCKDTYNLPVQALVSTIERLLSIFPGQNVKDLSTTNRRPGYTVEETSALFAQIGTIHIAALQCLSRILDRLGPTNKSLLIGVMEDLVWRFRDGVSSLNLRSSFYDTICISIEGVGPILSPLAVKKLDTLLNAAITDLLPTDYLKAKDNSSRLDADAYFQSPNQNRKSFFRHSVVASAQKLIETSLRRIPASSFSNTTRAALDRSVVLSRHPPAMLASVSNISVRNGSSDFRPSIIPFLGREYPSSLQVENLIRPRMPFINSESNPGQASDDNMILDLAVSLAPNNTNSVMSSQLAAMENPRSDAEPIAASASSQVEVLIPELVTRPLGTMDPTQTKDSAGILSPKRARPDEPQADLGEPIGQLKRAKIVDLEVAIDLPTPAVFSIVHDTPKAVATQARPAHNKPSDTISTSIVRGLDESDSSDESDVPPIILRDEDETDEDGDERFNPP